VAEGVPAFAPQPATSRVGPASASRASASRTQPVPGLRRLQIFSAARSRGELVLESPITTPWLFGSGKSGTPFAHTPRVDGSHQPVQQGLLNLL
jgi:hypothetical protein